MSQSFRRSLVSAAIVALILSLSAGTAFAQYTSTTLVKNTGKKGR